MEYYIPYGRPSCSLSATEDFETLIIPTQFSIHSMASENSENYTLLEKIAVHGKLITKNGCKTVLVEPLTVKVGDIIEAFDCITCGPTWERIYEYPKDLFTVTERRKGSDGQLRITQFKAIRSTPFNQFASISAINSLKTIRETISLSVEPEKKQIKILKKMF